MAAPHDAATRRTTSGAEIMNEPFRLRIQAAAKLAGTDVTSPRYCVRSGDRPKAGIGRRALASGVPPEAWTTGQIAEHRPQREDGLG